MRKVLRFLFWGIGMGIAPYSMAMELHPGRYSNETFDEPVVLCEPGQYKFNQCNFMIYDCDTGLRVHKGSDVVVNTCQFMGWGKYGNVGLGIFSESTLQVKNSYFSDLKYGLYYCNASGPPDTDNNLSNDQDIAMNQFENLNVGIRKCGSGKISIVGNSFTNNSESIVLGYDENGPATGIGIVIPQQAMLNMKCNSFITNELVARTGLVIENGVQVNGNGGNIGGNSNYTGASSLDYPNANYFPVHDNLPPLPTLRNHLPEDGNGDPVNNVQDPDFGWPDALNWKSINNQSAGNPVAYHRFVNEYVFKATGTAGEVSTPVSVSDQRAYTEWNNSSGNPPTGSDENPCVNYFPDVAIFPLRVAVDSTFTEAKGLLLAGASLGMAAPNPANTLNKVVIYLPFDVQNAVLQITESATGRVLQGILLNERGRMVAVISTAKAPAGSYRYRLVVDGKLIETKQLIVVH